MASTKMQDTKDHDNVRDDLSDAASSHADVRTLDEEPLPSYNESSAASAEQRPPEKGSSHLESYQAPEQSSTRQGPTVADPFAFPADELPSYGNADAIQRPLAIPQTTPSAAAPFLLAYPTALLSFGITTESWYSFVETLSAFLSAKVSQQAVHHAADIASSVGDFHKQYALRTKEHFKNMGKSAKRFSPVGLVSQTVGITMGTVGHIVGTVFQAAGSLTQKPQTPRARATVYLETANKKWFHLRGLHAVLMDTAELSKLGEVETQSMLSATQDCGSSRPDLQLAALRDIIGEVRVEEDLQSRRPAKVSSTSSSKAAGKRPMVPQLQLGSTTLWLVVVPFQDDVLPSEETTSQRVRH